MYPPVSALSRKCTKDYKIPGMDITLEKGCNILIPSIALQNDAKYFPQPDLFDPERFIDGKKPPVGTYLPFGDGPRSCIGMRMGRLNTIVGLATLLQKFHFDLDQRHIGNKLKLSPSTVLPVPTDGIHLKVRSRFQR